MCILFQVMVSGETRCSISSSPHSSESSAERPTDICLRPIPEDVRPFRDTNDPFERGDTVRIEKMDYEVDSPHYSNCDSANVKHLVKDNQESRFIFNRTFDRTNNSISTSEPGGGGGDANNSVLHSLFKKHVKTGKEPKLEKNEVVATFNNASPCFKGLEDILKDAKTSNVNVLVTEEQANNEIKFDSEKYPKHDSVRLRDTLENPNLTEFHNFDGKAVCVKRIKETNLMQENLDFVSECSDLSDSESSECFNNIKRMKLEEQEKNYRMECERKLRDLDKIDSNLRCQKMDVIDPHVNLAVSGPSCAGAVSCSGRSSAMLNEELEADKHWEKHLSANQSVIVDTFQGQFKSTVSTF